MIEKYSRLEIDYDISNGNEDHAFISMRALIVKAKKVLILYQIILIMDLETLTNIIDKTKNFESMSWSDIKRNKKIIR